MTLLDPADPRFVVGSEDDRRLARDEWRRQRFVVQLEGSALPQLDSKDLVFRPFSNVEHEPSGRIYKLRRDDLVDLEYAATAIAWFIDDTTGKPRLLEDPSPGPGSVQALQERQARKAERRAQPRPKPSWQR